MRVKSLDNKTIAEVREIAQPASTKGYLPMRLGRNISIYFSVFFFNLGLTPRFIAFTRFFIGLIGILFIGFGEYWAVATGLIILHISIFLDLTDGEVFRMKTWKQGKKDDVLFGSYIDKNFDQIYRPLLLIAAGIGAWHQFSNVIFLFFGMFGAFLISLDQLIKLRVLDSLVYKQEFEYLKEEKSKLEGKVTSTGKYDWVYELFRINNPLTLYFWFGIFGYLYVFLIVYVPLLFVLVVRTFFRQLKRVDQIDKELVIKYHHTNTKKSNKTKKK